MRKGLAVEAVIIGASAAAAGEVLSRLGMRTGNPVFWFAIGALTHVAWEVSGGNRWYLENNDPSDFPQGLLGPGR